jgi:hypothetical protein
MRQEASSLFWKRSSDGAVASDTNWARGPKPRGEACAMTKERPPFATGPKYREDPHDRLIRGCVVWRCSHTNSAYVHRRGSQPSCSSVLLLQICTVCPQDNRNGSATKHERNTGPLARCHSTVAVPSPRRNKGSNSVSLLPQGASKGSDSRSRHFSAATKASCTSNFVGAQIRSRIEFDV